MLDTCGITGEHLEFIGQGFFCRTGLGDSESDTSMIMRVCWRRYLILISPIVFRILS